MNRNYDVIPEELKTLDQWVAYKLVKEESRLKPTKIPYSPRTNRKASPTNPNDWGTFEEAKKVIGYDGIGFVFTEDDIYCGIDLDECRNIETGIIEDWAQEIINEFDSYTELSPSGTGVHILIKGNLPPGGNRKGQIEMYSTARYFTITGDKINGCNIRKRNRVLKEFHAKLFELSPETKPVTELKTDLKIGEIYNKALNAVNGDKFKRLFEGEWREDYDSQSEADLALCSILSFWAVKDPLKIDRLFRHSKLKRKKWDEKRGDTTYGATVIKKAIENTLKVYNPGEVQTDKNSYDKDDTLTDRDILEMDLPDVFWVVKGLIPEGLTILAGKAKLGKSWLVLNLALAITSGRDVFGKLPVKKQEVLYLALEDTERRVKGRLQQLNCSPSGLFYFKFKWQRGEDGEKDLKDWLKKHPNVKLIIIDTLQRIREMAKKSANNLYQIDYETISGLKSIADKFSISIIVIHHLRKADAEDSLDTISGSTGITGAADTLMILKRARGGVEATLEITGRDIEEQKLVLSKDPKGVWTLLGNAEEIEQSKERKAILEVLKNSDKPLTPTEIANMLGTKPGNVKYLLGKLKEEKFVESPEYGKYLAK